MRLGWDEAKVGAATIKFVSLKGRARLCTREFSAKVSRFISDFDWENPNGLPFKPFSFTIQDIPDLSAGNPG